MGNSDPMLGENSYPDGSYRLETSYPGELVESVSLEVFGTWLDTVLSKGIYLDIFGAGGWTRWPLEVSSKLQYVLDFSACLDSSKLEIWTITVYLSVFQIFTSVSLSSNLQCKCMIILC